MAKRTRPTLTVTVDPDVRSELARRQKDEALNVSGFVNRALRPLLKKPAKSRSK